jgi:hypothetical protein
MSAALGAACLWLILANVIAMFPSRDHHWRNAYVLIAIGLPILGWLWVSAGWFAAVAVFIGGASILRWPVVYLFRWLRKIAGR